jgi:hypothetical protein
MTTQSTERFGSGIDIAKVIAGTLAAVSAAVCASVLGVAGTLIGAAVASLVGTVGQELYAQSLRRGYRKLRDPRGTRISASAATPGTQTPGTGATDSRPASASTLRSSAARPEVPGAHPVPARPGTAKPKRPLWQRIALATLAAFVLAMIAVSAVELISGRALAGIFGDDAAGATTISSVVKGPRTPEATPTPVVTSDTPTSAPTTEPTATATAEPTATTEAPVAPTADPTTAPTADATQQAPDPAPTGLTPTGQ